MRTRPRIPSTAGPFTGRPAKAPVEIDHMQPLEALAGKACGLGGGIVVEDDRLVHAPLDEAHAAPLLQVNRRKQDHGRHRKKFAMRARPSRWLFSGWNWVPAMLSRLTSAVTGPP